MSVKCILDLDFGTLQLLLQHSAVLLQLVSLPVSRALGDDHVQQQVLPLPQDLIRVVVIDRPQQVLGSVLVLEDKLHHLPVL